MEPVTFALIMAGASAVSSIFGGNQQQSLMDQKLKSQQEQNAMNMQMFNQKMAMEKANMANNFNMNGAQLAAMYGAPGQPVTVSMTDPSGAGGGGGGGGGGCPAGQTYVAIHGGNISAGGSTAKDLVNQGYTDLESCKTV